MDTTSRKKEKAARGKRTGSETASHVSDGYDAPVRPRDSHPAAVDKDRLVSENLDKLNRDLVDAPAATEDTGAKVETRKVKSRAAAPVAVIFSCLLIAAVFMYMLSLNVKVEEYSKSISELQTDINRLKEEATRLEVQLESRYDLDEVERIATEQYGMVSADSLPKKYVSVSDGADVLQVQPGEEENGFHSLITGFVSAIRDLMS